MDTVLIKINRIRYRFKKKGESPKMIIISEAKGFQLLKETNMFNIGWHERKELDNILLTRDVKRMKKMLKDFTVCGLPIKITEVQVV